jgi:mono/diheme cytochrome c family protein
MLLRVCLPLLVAGPAWFGALSVLAHESAKPQAAAEPVEFNRHIRPILSDHCFVCHGPDAKNRKGKLRLDTEKDAFAERDGYRILVPGKPGDSELYRRVSAHDARERMPPRKADKPLTPKQIDLIRRWVEQGAQWQNHWSLIAATRPQVPRVEGAWPRNAIDRFVLARMREHGLQPSPEADRRTLMRRLSFDLTGLPPTPDAVDAFLADKAPDAYEKLVDRLLASPHYGERMAQYWLDVVRYADTGGYHSDNHRDVAPYRDYVISGFNDNLPFDRFTVEQLAGDLLPDATTAQKVASGYNRLLQTTEEGGAQPKEYQAKYAADRVRNTATAWLGLTMGCAECHDHKFDPITTREFYRFAAFFADVNERAVGRQEQTMLPSAEQAARLRKLDEQIAPLQRQMNVATPELEAAQAKWEETVREAKSQGLPKPVADVLAIDAAKRSPKQKEIAANHYRSVAPELAEPRQQLAELQRQKQELNKAVPTTLVSMAVPPRATRVLPRGNWLDESGDIVTPDVPASLRPLKIQDRRATRLDLARWMVAPENPLTARVFVNRLWMLFHGQGLVKTMDDFGSQGAWPTHPELLDWLAVEFRESGWDVKRLVKLLVTSSIYRQSSRATEELRQRDPYNLWLARQGRFRLDAEFVRDNALAVSGLLSRKIGGPSVKPYQPAGYWAYLNFPVREWQKDSGENLYRRGLYTYWQRTFLHPSLLAFDASTREECTVERARSNTPQQALVLLNDPTYVEASRVLSERAVREGGNEVEKRVEFLFRQALCRTAEGDEVEILSELYRKHLQQYTADKGAAEALLRVGDRPALREIPAAELAAWTSVARVVLNLHETITRE